MNYVYEIDHTVLSKPILKYVEPVKKKGCSPRGPNHCQLFSVFPNIQVQVIRPAARLAFLHPKQEQNHLFNQLSKKCMELVGELIGSCKNRLVISNMGGFLNSPWNFR